MDADVVEVLTVCTVVDCMRCCSVPIGGGDIV
jgi:hypothetical protein